MNEWRTLWGEIRLAVSALDRLLGDWRSHLVRDVLRLRLQR